VSNDSGGLNIIKSIGNTCKLYVLWILKGILKVDNLITFLLVLLIFLNSILLLGILFDLESLCILFDLESLCNIEFCTAPIEKLKELYGSNLKNGFNFVNVVTSLGALIGLLLFHLRNQAMTDQTKSQYKIFNDDKQFSNFLEATKLLTAQDSTTEAKIAAMFSLADVAKAHPKHLDRIIQVLNKGLIPLLQVVNRKNASKPYTTTLKEKKVIGKPISIKTTTEIFDVTKNKRLNIDLFDRKSRENIKDWQYNGDEVEMVVSIALYVVRKIILELKDDNSKFDFSNTIFFDIDNNFDKKSVGKKFIPKDNKRIENAIFLDCKLKNVDFREVNYHFCKFINCDLTEANFSDANLWGTSFENCNFKNVKFKGAECECLELANCKNFTIKQLNKMKFVNIDKYREGKEGSEVKYLMIMDVNEINKDDKDDKLSQANFITLEEYYQWKNSDQS